jgi:SAM-dependent methyltransferase
VANLILDIGCGTGKTPGAVGLDKFPGPGVDVQWDITKFPWPFQNSWFDQVISHQVLEHVPYVETDGYADVLFAIFDEVYRVLKPGGTFEFDVPHPREVTFFGDLTHRRFFNLNSFSFFWDPSRNPQYRRRSWKLKSTLVTRAIPFRWHLRYRTPRLYRVISSMHLGRPVHLVITLEKP